ncbi:MAG: Methyltransferase type 11 [Chloroflexi bacterium]|nr:Methyltransferase type 11 [Chloroflexota bacterium]
MHDALSDPVSEVRAYYEKQPDREWHRLLRHRVEYAITIRALRDALPAGARVLDAGGGPGRYAVALASAGHTVTLFDLSPKLLARARHHAAERKVQLAGYVEGTATNLAAFDNASFEAVLLLGPLYHLPLVEDREQVLREARRVLVPGGALIAAFMTRYAPIRTLARQDPRLLIRDAERYETLLSSGVLPGPVAGDEAVHGYFARAEEIPPLLEGAGFAPPRLLAAEGIVDGIEDRVVALQGPAWTAWADLNYDLADDPGLLAATSHILAITRRLEESD